MPTVQKDHLTVNYTRISGICITITVAKLPLGSSSKIILWLGITTAWGALLKGCSIGRAENHCSRQRLRENRKGGKKGRGSCLTSGMQREPGLNPYSTCKSPGLSVLRSPHLTQTMRVAHLPLMKTKQDNKIKFS